MNYKLIFCGALAAICSIMSSSAIANAGGENAAYGINSKNYDKESARYSAQAYNKILNNFYELLSNRSNSGTEIEGAVGVLELISLNGGEKNLLDSVGYSIQDISGDGIPELVIGYIEGKNGNTCYGSVIYTLYTSVNGAPRHVFEGMQRNSYHFMDNGTLLYQGSAGAMYSIFGVYSLSQDGTSLCCKDFYFTFEKDKNFKEIGFYHNTSGKWDKALSEELKITADDFWNIQEKLGTRIQKIQLVPFSAYKTQAKNAHSANVAKSDIRAQWAEDALPGLSAYDLFIADKAAQQTKIVFSAENSVKNFKVLALSIKDVDENGKAAFAVKELFTRDSLTPARPLVVGMTFYGDTPHYGISYVGKNGETRRFTVGISGENGALLLSEF